MFTDLDHLCHDGYTMLSAVYTADEISDIARRVTLTLEARSDESVLRTRGAVYGSRNLVEVFPEVLQLIDRPRLRQVAANVLGERAGVVRILFFDKPPNATWSLPWHKDWTIAVKRNDLPSRLFQKPTVKAGGPHVEAPVVLLQNMLTFRLHLDAMTSENGPLHVIPGSHNMDVDATESAVELNAEAGDVLAMRPLLSHASTASRSGTTSHRRIIHVELAGEQDLRDGYQWHFFHPIRSEAD
ncbi:MAG: phytanoyl-CoA dioxygenase family protein [Pirellulaceae bacterium]|nr:phytanoyl-CoA dioxygenase family protein [Planctomycetales bacterium]